MIPVQNIISQYLEKAIALAEYDKIADNSFSGRVPNCPGVIAFGSTLAQCMAELRSTLEEWLLIGLKMGHQLPIIDGIDLNQEPRYETLESM